MGLPVTGQALLIGTNNSTLVLMARSPGGVESAGGESMSGASPLKTSSASVSKAARLAESPASICTCGNAWRKVAIPSVVSPASQPHERVIPGNSNQVANTSTVIGVRLSTNSCKDSWPRKNTRPTSLTAVSRKSRRVRRGIEPISSRLAS